MDDVVVHHQHRPARTLKHEAVLSFAAVSLADQRRPAVTRLAWFSRMLAFSL
jgi:hypothetical protein